MTTHRWMLLAEDNPKDADLALRALSAEQPPGEIVLTGDGAETLDCLYRRGAFRSRQRDPPAVVLLDLKMPKVDGLEVLRQIKTDTTLRRSRSSSSHPPASEGISCGLFNGGPTLMSSSRSIFGNISPCCRT